MVTRYGFFEYFSCAGIPSCTSGVTLIAAAEFPPEQPVHDPHPEADDCKNICWNRRQKIAMATKTITEVANV
jgi:hypothetical protein